MNQLNVTDYNRLKASFIEELIKKDKTKRNEEYAFEIEENFFLYANEFEDYAKKELNIDYSNQEKNIDKLTSEENLEILLQLINEEEELKNQDSQEAYDLEPSKETESNKEAGTQTANSEEEINFLNAAIADMFKNEEFKNIVDNDANGEISEEELLNMINTITEFDSNEDTVSLNDIIQTMTKTAESDFQIQTEASLEESIKNADTYTTTTRENAGGWNNGYGTKNYQGSYNTAEEALDNKSVEQLETIVLDREETLNQKQEILSNIQNDTNEDLANLKQEAQTAFQAYTEKLNEIDSNKANKLIELTQTKEEIEKNNTEITNLDTTIADCDNSLGNIHSRISVLNNQKSKLQSAEDKNGTITAQLSALQSELNQLESQEDEINKQKEAAQKNKEALKARNEELEEQYGNIDEEISKLEEEILKIENEDLQQAKVDYENKKTEFETTKKEALTKAQQEVEEATKLLNEAKKELVEEQNNVAKRIYSPDGLTQNTRNAIEKAFQELGIREVGGENMGEDVLKYGGNAGDPWCASFVSWLYKDSPLAYNASVSGLRNQAIEAGYYSKEGTYTPKPGDIMIQKENGAGHTGIVTGFDGEYVYTIEGNSGDAVRERRYRVGSSEYAKISGWIRMNEWCGGSSDIPTDTFIAQTNGEDAERQGRTTY